MSITDRLIQEQFEKDRKDKTMNTAKRMIWVTFRKEGMLISFPGWINHQVKDNFSNNDRISIAFNCDLSGSALDNPTL